MNKHNPIQKKKTKPNPNQQLGCAQYSAPEKFILYNNTNVNKYFNVCY